MAFGMEVGLGPGHIVLHGDPAPLTERGTTASSFWLMSIVAKWSPISATAVLLLHDVIYELSVWVKLYCVKKTACCNFDMLADFDTFFDRWYV